MKKQEIWRELAQRELARRSFAEYLAYVQGRMWKRTRMAEFLAGQLGCRVVHTDDFYLPLAVRCANWQEQPGANIDFIRLRNEVLQPLLRGETALYNAYSCAAGAFLPSKPFAAAPLTILEGSYSHHPLLAGYETLRVFVTCSREEQTRRLQAREGERYANFAARWIPLEEGYFAQYRIEETADLAVDTTAANSCAGMMCR